MAVLAGTYCELGGRGASGVLRLTALLSASAALLTGCGRGVTVSPPTPTLQAATACQALSAALPARVLGEQRRPIEPESPWTAAWGGSPIVLRCGVPAPVAMQPTSELLTVDSIDWLPETLDRGALFTTVGRTAYVEVTVPTMYAPEARALTDLAAAVRTAVPPVGA